MKDAIDPFLLSFLWETKLSEKLEGEESLEIVFMNVLRLSTLRESKP
jgi:hypothetical protein